MKLILDTELLENAPDINEEYNMSLLGYGIATPEPNFNLVDVPGRNGTLDLTSALGTVTYKNRNVWFASRMNDTTTRLIQRYSTLANKFHGQRCRMVFDDEPDYYFDGRCTISRDYIDNGAQTIRFDLEADPFKYPVYAANENWLWDPFNFNTGVIRKYANIAVSGTKVVDVIGYDQPESPRFVVSLNQGQSSMRMVYGEDTYYLTNGTNSFPAVTIQSLDVHTDIHRFTFYGYGKVSINIKGGIL